MLYLCTVYSLHPPPQTTPMGCLAENRDTVSLRPSTLSSHSTITFIPLYTINPITFINTILGHPYYLEPCRPHNLEFTICHTIWNHAGLTTWNSLSIVLSGTRPHNLKFTIYRTIWNQASQPGIQYLSYYLEPGLTTWNSLSTVSYYLEPGLTTWNSLSYYLESGLTTWNSLSIILSGTSLHTWISPA